MKIFKVIKPVRQTSPVVLSVPHCGVNFPPEIISYYKQELLPPDDTDWFVDQLYSFAAEMGIVLIRSNISRWVIDLNRNPDGKPLYNDGRVITALCPTTDFNGNKLYGDERSVVNAVETERRKTVYFEPYHEQLSSLITGTKDRFGKVLLWDCHSIRRTVPSISATPFPDMILGSADGASAPEMLVEIAMQNLASSIFTVKQNHPFKGGYITRHYGNPDNNEYALQLEMTKDLYMDDAELHYDVSKAFKMQALLSNTLASLTDYLLSE